MTLGELLGDALKLDAMVTEAIASGGVHLPAKITVHSHGRTVVFDGTATATKDGTPMPSQRPNE